MIKKMRTSNGGQIWEFVLATGIRMQKVSYIK